MSSNPNERPGDRVSQWVAPLKTQKGGPIDLFAPQFDPFEPIQTYISGPMLWPFTHSWTHLIFSTKLISQIAASYVSPTSNWFHLALNLAKESPMAHFQVKSLNPHLNANHPCGLHTGYPFLNLILVRLTMSNLITNFNWVQAQPNNNSSDPVRSYSKL